MREKLLEREEALLDALKKGPRTFMELNRALFQDRMVQFFPGCGITESHLIKLEKEGIITRDQKQTVMLND
jgi:hypothetical protein